MNKTSHGHNRKATEKELTLISGIPTKQKQTILRFPKVNDFFFGLTNKCVYVNMTENSEKANSFAPQNAANEHTSSVICMSYDIIDWSFMLLLLIETTDTESKRHYRFQ